MAKRLLLNLLGTLNGRSIHVERDFDLSQGGLLDIDGAQAGDTTLAIVAATLPALMLREERVRVVDDLPVHSRTRLDLLGEHGRDLGSAVIVCEMRDELFALACDATVQHGTFSLEMSERVRISDREFWPRIEPCGVAINASMFASGSRGADYVVDLSCRLWNVEAVSSPGAT